MPSQLKRPPVLTISILTIAVMVFVGITAAEGGSSINVPLPTLSDVIVGAAVTVFGFFGKRAFGKLDEVATKTDRIDVALRGYNGEGGALQDIRDLQSVVYRDDGIAPRGVAPPAGFTVGAAIHARREDPT